MTAAAFRLVERAALVLAEAAEPDVRALGLRLVDALHAPAGDGWAALGLVGDWRTRCRLDARDGAIAELKMFVQADTDGGASEEIAVMLARYRAGAWQRDRAMAALPPGSPELRRGLHRVLLLNRGATLTARQVRNILGRRRGG